jgi:hypothetical protein
VHPSRDSGDPRVRSPQAVGPSEARWSAALRPQLDRLGLSDTARAAAPSIPEELEVAEQTLRLDPWERMVLRIYGTGDDVWGRPWPSLVAQVVALRARRIESAAKTGRAADSDPTGRAALLEAAKIDAEIVGRLQARLQWTHRKLADAGEAYLARRVTDLIDAVDRIGARVRSFLGEELYAGLAVCSLDPDYARRWPESSSGAGSGPRAAPDRSAGAASTARGHAAVRLRVRVRRRDRVGMALAAALAAALLFVFTPRRGDPGAASGPESALLSAPGVVSVDGRGATLSVTVREEDWLRLSTDRRREQLRRMAAIAGRSGHDSLEILGEDGLPLAGTQLGPDGPRATAPPARERRP